MPQHTPVHQHRSRFAQPGPVHVHPSHLSENLAEAMLGILALVLFAGLAVFLAGLGP